MPPGPIRNKLMNIFNAILTLAAFAAAAIIITAISAFVDYDDEE